jgi:hypothetical protein
VLVGGGHAGGRGARAVHRESVLRVNRRGIGPEEGPRRWGAELSGAGSSGRGGQGGSAAPVWGRTGVVQRQSGEEQGGGLARGGGSETEWREGGRVALEIRTQASTGNMETWREQSDTGATASPRARGAQPGPARSADPEAPAEERLHGGVLQRADDEARAQLQKGGGGGCRGRCARGRKRHGRHSTRWRRHKRLREESRHGGPRWPERQWNLVGLA